MENEFKYGNLVFKIGDPIGDWGHDFSNAVYEASVRVTLSKMVSYPYSNSNVAVKIAPENDAEAKSFLEQELGEPDIFKSTPRSILLHHHSFKSIRNDVKNLVVVLPFEKEVVSIRETMYFRAPTFRFGIPEDCISFALRGAAKGLIEIHLCKKFHKRLTAGTIYYHRNERNIKLAYGAALYERTYIFVQSPASCPLPRLSQWGRAPEIQSLSDERYTSACDVWLIGLAALEMAYGTIEVASREELLFIADYVSKNRHMPPVWTDLREEFSNRNKASVLSLKSVGYFLVRCCVNVVSKLVFPKPKRDEPLFSR